MKENVSGCFFLNTVYIYKNIQKYNKNKALATMWK